MKKSNLKFISLLTLAIIAYLFIRLDGKSTVGSYLETEAQVEASQDRTDPLIGVVNSPLIPRSGQYVIEIPNARSFDAIRVIVNVDCDADLREDPQDILDKVQGKQRMKTSLDSNAILLNTELLEPQYEIKD